MQRQTIKLVEGSCLLKRQMNGEGSFILDYRIFLVRFEFFTMYIYYFPTKMEIFFFQKKWGATWENVFSLPPHVNVFELKSGEKKTFKLQIFLMERLKYIIFLSHSRRAGSSNVFARILIFLSEKRPKMRWSWEQTNISTSDI